MQTTLKGLCECGCGGAAPIITRTNRNSGQVAGEPRRFISGHNSRVERGTLGYFMTRVSIGSADGCWNWTGPANKKGYGSAQLNGVKHLAHKAIYLLHGLRVPAGFHLDHLCLNKLCVNPLHLEPVTAAENVRRQHEVRRARIKDQQCAV